MRRSLFLTLSVCLFIYGTGLAASSDSLPPAHPCDIVSILSRHTIPRVEFREATLWEALTSIHTKYITFDRDPPWPTHFAFEYRLPETILQRRVSFHAKDITMIQAIKRTLADVSFAMTFEPGKVTFSSPSPEANAPTSALRQ
jgi:hypothetical protein